MRRFHGVATKYLGSDLGWRRLLDRFQDSLTAQQFLFQALQPRYINIWPEHDPEANPMKFVIETEQPAQPVIEQIVSQIRHWIESGKAKPGMKLPSIRQFAATHNISRFSVVGAYDRLTSLGLITAKSGSGFYVTGQARLADNMTLQTVPVEAAESMTWQMFDGRHDRLQLGRGWLPDSWHDADGLSYAIRHVTRSDIRNTVSYSTPLGDSILREHIRSRLRFVGIETDVKGIVLMTGANQALDLLIRCLLQPGDTVLVEDPGYFILYRLLKFHGVRMISVPRTVAGPDINALEQILLQYRPKLFFINSILHNPTGTIIAPPVMFRVLKFAQQYDFRIVEDDIYCDFCATATDRLASLDQLDRVIYVGSYSKTLSSSIRVGFVAAEPSLVNHLADVKMLTGITASRFGERVVAEMLASGMFRKMLTRMHDRLRRAMGNALDLLDRSGWEVFHEPAGGMFVWARRPGVDDSSLFVEQARRHDVSLAPGSAFRPHEGTCPWVRINVAYLMDARARRFIAEAGK